MIEHNFMKYLFDSGDADVLDGLDNSDIFEVIKDITPGVINFFSYNQNFNEAMLAATEAEDEGLTLYGWDDIPEIFTWIAFDKKYEKSLNILNKYVFHTKDLLIPFTVSEIEDSYSQ